MWILKISLRTSPSPAQRWRAGAEIGGELSGIVTGKITEITKHPNADRLVICKVDIGKEMPLTIVTHAPNVFEGA